MLETATHNIWYFPKGLVLSPPPKPKSRLKWLGWGIDILAYFALGGLIALWLSSLGTDLSTKENDHLQRTQVQTDGRD